MTTTKTMKNNHDDNKNHEDGSNEEFGRWSSQVLSGAGNSQLGREQYPEYLETTSACEKAIHRDIAR